MPVLVKVHVKTVANKKNNSKGGVIQYGSKTNSRKRRVKKNIDTGVAHIHSTFNNTIVTITDPTWKCNLMVKCWCIRIQRIS